MIKNCAKSMGGGGIQTDQIWQFLMEKGVILQEITSHHDYGKNRLVWTQYLHHNFKFSIFRGIRVNLYHPRVKINVPFSNNSTLFFLEISKKECRKFVADNGLFWINFDILSWIKLILHYFSCYIMPYFRWGRAIRGHPQRISHLWVGR